MRIGIVLSQAPGYSETFFNNKIKGLQQKGMEVILFSQSNKSNFSLCPVVESPKVSSNLFLQAWWFLKVFTLLIPHYRSVVRFIGLERKEGNGLIAISKKIYLNSHLLKAKMDWLHFGFATMALGSETVAKAIGAKMAVSFRGFDMVVYPEKYPGCYTKLWKYVDKVHTISDYLLGLAKINGLPDSIPASKITPAVAMEIFAHKTSNFKVSNDLVFITTARLHWIKGLVSTLEALAMLKEKGFAFTYKIIGEGKEYERIAFAAYQLGLKDEVQFLGKLPHEEVKKALEDAHIYLQYSVQEGFCNAVLEAQAMGKLCIVSNAGGLAENVLHEQTGWVVAKNSPKPLANQIEKVLLLTDEEKEHISTNASERVRKEFDIEKQLLAFLDFYKEKNV